MNTETRIPLFLQGNALQALRDAGYSLSAALGEVVDNSLEANANNIRIVLEETTVDRKKRIGRIVVADDGDGMPEGILARYLQIGFSTRFMSTSTIGRYGVGAKFGALNYCTQIHVWSRTSEAEPWRHVCLDIDDIKEQERRGEVAGIDPPDAVTIPTEIAALLPPWNRGEPRRSSGSGTVVVWSKVDRLTEGAQAENSEMLRVAVERDLSRMFRHFLDGGIKISVNGKNLLPHDPLFLMENTWGDQALRDHYRAGDADLSGYWDGEDVPSHFPAEVFAKDLPLSVGGSTALLTVTLAPRVVIRERYKGGDTLARKLRVPENQGCLSFVRLNREINYAPVARSFPDGIQDPDRFIGVEIKFSPELDAFFGVRNVKQGVMPQDDLRKQIRGHLRKYIPEARRRIDEIWGEPRRRVRVHRGEHTDVLMAVKQVNPMLPKPIGSDDGNVDQVLEDFVSDVLGKDATDEQRQEYRHSLDGLPIALESVDVPGPTLIDVKHLGHQILVRLNTRHRFYRELWTPLRELAETSPAEVSPAQAVSAAQRAIQMLRLLITAYVRAEGMHPAPTETYGDLRYHWGAFLETLLYKTKEHLAL